MSDSTDIGLLDPGAIEALLTARHGDPFAVLGPHELDGHRIVRTLQPGAQAVEAIDAQGRVLASLARIHPDGLFAGEVPGQGRYRLRVHWHGAIQELDDPYAFGLLLDEADLAAFARGEHPRPDTVLGAHPARIDGIDGVRFAVWAPNARRVSVIGDFNVWDGRRHPMRLRLPYGVWEIFVPGIGAGERYKYEVRGVDEVVRQKADPFARAAEPPPATASVVADDTPFPWTDQAWMGDRAGRQRLDSPLLIYELHAGSWWRDEDGQAPDWDGLAARLIPYVTGMGFTHVELLPIAEHPFGGSWGYQPLGQYAPSARFGPPEAFARFVNRCHEAGLGVILDWVPAHFPTDAHGLVRFDGTALYEYDDPREGFHPDWNTLVYNLGRNEVSSFLIGSALAWAERYHVDGLRVDAVASMLYRDYSRRPGEWIPNIHGGRENLEAIAFLKRFNTVLHQYHPDVLTIAEESTAWPGVTRPPAEGGLGFDYKWNMGWMHDTLQYMSREPIHRRWHHHEMTFAMVYAYSEHYVLPLSHDEVVHGKRSLLGRMPGDDWQRFANLRAYYGFMWGHPGKKLLFAGGELAQPTEWNHDAQLPWHLLDDPRHRGVQLLLRDLNRLLRSTPALHGWDVDPRGFRWTVGDDSTNSVFAWLRFAEGAAPVLVISNMTPVPRHDYRIGVPDAGCWRLALNTDAAGYGGSGVGQGEAWAEPVPAHGQPHSLVLTLPPLATVIYVPG